MAISAGQRAGVFALLMVGPTAAHAAQINGPLAEPDSCGYRAPPKVLSDTGFHPEYSEAAGVFNCAADIVEQMARSNLTETPAGKGVVYAWGKYDDALTRIREKSLNAHNWEAVMKGHAALLEISLGNFLNREGDHLPAQVRGKVERSFSDLQRIRRRDTVYGTAGWQPDTRPTKGQIAVQAALLRGDESARHVAAERVHSLAEGIVGFVEAEQRAGRLDLGRPLDLGVAIGNLTTSSAVVYPADGRTRGGRFVERHAKAMANSVEFYRSERAVDSANAALSIGKAAIRVQPELARPLGGPLRELYGLGQVLNAVTGKPAFPPTAFPEPVAKPADLHTVRADMPAARQPVPVQPLRRALA